MSYEDQEYHRRRAEIELEQAIAAEAEQSAVAHLTLARMHRFRRQAISEQVRRHSARPAIFGTDKEA